MTAITCAGDPTNLALLLACSQESVELRGISGSPLLLTDFPYQEQALIVDTQPVLARAIENCGRNLAQWMVSCDPVCISLVALNHCPMPFTANRQRISQARGPRRVCVIQDEIHCLYEIECASPTGPQVSTGTRWVGPPPRLGHQGWCARDCVFWRHATVSLTQRQ